MKRRWSSAAGLASFQSAGYRWLWAGVFLYVMSLVISRLAMGWLVLTLTDSAYWVGLAAGVDGVGKILFGLFGGVLVDHQDKRRVLWYGLLLYGLLGAGLGALIEAGAVGVPALLLVAFLLGGIDSVLTPASNAIVFHLVGRERVMNAAALNLLGFYAARTVAAAVAGIVIARVGLGPVWLLAGLLAVLAVLPLLRVRGHFMAATERPPFLAALREGLHAAWQDRDLRRVLGLSVITELFGFSHFVLIPVMARDVLGVGAEGLGYLTSASGLGATLGTALLAGLGDIRRKGALLWGGTVAAAGLLIGLAASPWYALSLAISAVMGLLLAGYDALMQAMVQLLSPDAVRGRILSLYVLTFGFTSVGGYVAGIIASVAGAPLAIALGGGFMLAYLAAEARPLARLKPGAEPAPAD
ncbi:MAG: MFS transporter [Anaerolineales bacterium]|nr:MFS transporter [Anaerolineales bacterium]